MSHLTIPEECKLLLTPQGFYNRWQYWTGRTRTYKEAYHKTEAETWYYFQTHKYKDYYSFKAVRTRKSKK